ncbi:MAG TPA: glycosyltransferase family 2 protein [Thermoanaerobaculia bacterium]|nr:glycosyltransferase family 2 protein [Thermoanaerobaculia bacterium]
MKLVIQIPAWNEEATLSDALASLPRNLPGFSEVLILVVDDGSTDRTAEVAREGFADRLVRFSKHRGLASAFSAGLDASLEMGADVIVNFDADLQYDPADIPRLVEPILEGRADIVVGDRGPGKLAHFSPVKRLLQRLGSWMVRQATGLNVQDATSGLRACTREAARRMNVFSKMTYTLEMLIQAGFKDLRVVSVPVSGRPVRRASRLLSSPTKYVLIQGANILRITALYKPLKIFSGIAALFLLVGVVCGVWALVEHLTGDPGPHTLALLVGGGSVFAGMLTFLMALLSDIAAINRELLEDLKLRESRNSTAESRLRKAEFRRELDEDVFLHREQ